MRTMPLMVFITKNAVLLFGADTQWTADTQELSYNNGCGSIIIKMENDCHKTYGAHKRVDQYLLQRYHQMGFLLFWHWLWSVYFIIPITVRLSNSIQIIYTNWFNWYCFKITEQPLSQLPLQSYYIDAAQQSIENYEWYALNLSRWDLTLFMFCQLKDKKWKLPRLQSVAFCFNSIPSAISIQQFFFGWAKTRYTNSFWQEKVYQLITQFCCTSRAKPNKSMYNNFTWNI